METIDTKTTECVICYSALTLKSYCFCDNQTIHRVCSLCYENLTEKKCPVCRQSVHTDLKKNEYDIRLLKIEPATPVNRVFMYVERHNNVSNFSFQEDISFQELNFKLVADCHIQLYCENKKLYAKYHVNQDYILRYICNQLHIHISKKYNLHSLQNRINSDNKEKIQTLVQFICDIPAHKANILVRLNNVIGLTLYQADAVEALFLNGQSIIPSEVDMKQGTTTVNTTSHIMTNYILQRTLQLQINLIDLEERDKYTTMERFTQRCKLYF